MAHDPLTGPHAPATRLLLGALLAALGAGCLLVLRSFIAPLIWALILAYVTWPAYRLVRTAMGRFRSTAAMLMTLLMCAAVLVPLFWLLRMIQGELLNAYHFAGTTLSQDPQLLARTLDSIPWIGQHWQGSLQQYTADPALIPRELLRWAQAWTREITGMLGALLRNLGKLLIAVLALFFIYRDGDALRQQTQRVAARLFADRIDRYVVAAGTMTRAVLFGFLVTALAQGTVAGLGYWIFGLQAAALLGAATALLSAVPLIGTAAVWVPAGVWLVLHDRLWQGLGLLAWGTLLVHPTDNVLRPLLISSASRVPFLIILLGALGGISAFGLVGGIVGPVLLGLAVAIWREWATGL